MSQAQIDAQQIELGLLLILGEAYMKRKHSILARLVLVAPAACTTFGEVSVAKGGGGEFLGSRVVREGR